MLAACPLAFVPFPTELLAGRLVARRDRFLADVILDGAAAGAPPVVAHCVNPGRMEAFVTIGARVFLSLAPVERQRKCAYTWELLEHVPPGAASPVLCGCNTQWPNDLALALLRARTLEGLREYEALQREVALPLTHAPLVLPAVDATLAPDPPAATGPPPRPARRSGR